LAPAEREGYQPIPADQKSINHLAHHFPFIVPPATPP